MSAVVEVIVRSGPWGAVAEVRVEVHDLSLGDERHAYRLANRLSRDTGLPVERVVLDHPRREARVSVYCPPERALELRAEVDRAVAETL